ncbi:hypothetical protein HWV62_43483 [Athelia sp. TMB]|nr:hypothetical protein HWV62_43483 [Athelia sp. TMB]
MSNLPPQSVDTPDGFEARLQQRNALKQNPLSTVPANEPLLLGLSVFFRTRSINWGSLVPPGLVSTGLNSRSRRGGIWKSAA